MKVSINTISNRKQRLAIISLNFRHYENRSLGIKAENLSSILYSYSGFWYLTRSSSFIPNFFIDSQNVIRIEFLSYIKVIINECIFVFLQNRIINSAVQVIISKLTLNFFLIKMITFATHFSLIISIYYLIARRNMIEVVKIRSECASEYQNTYSCMYTRYNAKVGTTLSPRNLKSTREDKKHPIHIHVLLLVKSSHLYIKPHITQYGRTRLKHSFRSIPSSSILLVWS